jgi:hypothetical protein
MNWRIRIPVKLIIVAFVVITPPFPAGRPRTGVFQPPRPNKTSSKKMRHHLAALPLVIALGLFLTTFYPQGILNLATTLTFIFKKIGCTSFLVRCFGILAFH